MAKLKEEARDYEPKQIKNIADLPSISIDVEVNDRNDVDYPYKYITVDGQEYKVPLTVLSNLKAILKLKPELKNFKVDRSGTGINTEYTVIPLD